MLNSNKEPLQIHIDFEYGTACTHDDYYQYEPMIICEQLFFKGIRVTEPNMPIEICITRLQSQSKCVKKCTQIDLIKKAAKLIDDGYKPK